VLSQVVAPQVIVVVVPLSEPASSGLPASTMVMASRDASIGGGEASTVVMTSVCASCPVSGRPASPTLIASLCVSLPASCGGTLESLGEVASTGGTPASNVVTASLAGAAS
jgi:hypothetical protein